MKKLFLIILLGLISFVSIGQTTYINGATGNGNFEAGAGSWNIVNQTTNMWFIGTNYFCNGTRGGYVGTAVGNNNYTNSIVQISHLYHNITNFVAGETQISLSFNYRGQGESTYDGLQVFLTDAPPVAGTACLVADQIGSIWYNLQAGCTTANITIPSTYAGTNKYLVFQWKNDGSLGSSPAITVDDVILTSTVFNCNTALGTGVTNIPLLPYTQNGQTTCGFINDITSSNVVNVCGSTLYYDGEDRVYIFTPITSGEITINLTSTGTWTGIMLYNGCPFTTGTCVGNSQSSSGNKTLTVCVTAGQTYYLIIDSYPSPTCNPYDINITSPIGCSGTPNNGTVSASVNPITCASPSSVLTGSGLSVGCGISYQWQSSPTGGAPWTNITGATNTTVTVSPIVNTYYRIVTTCSGSGLSNNSSSIYVTTTVTPPANDNCTGALVLTVNADLACGVVTAGTTLCATNSGIAACVGTGADDDVWFRFVATNTNLNTTITNTGGSSDCVHEIFTGTCGSLTSVACSDPESSAWTGLTVGNTYYIRVHTYGSGTNSQFNICLGTPPPPPTNDDPCGAISLNVNTGSCSYQTAILNTSTTATVGIPAPGCGSLGPDIWFTAVVPASGRLIIDISPSGGPTDMCMAWYTGPNCSNINSLIECDDDDSQNGSMPMICRTGVACTVPGDCAQNATLTPGTLIYVRVWEYGGGTFGPFDICAYEPQPPGAASTCASATVINSLPFSDAGQTTCCRVNDYTTATSICVSSYQDGEDFLYTYTPSANTTIDITLTGTLSYTGLFVTERCPTAGGASCIAQATSATGNPTLCGVSLTAGKIYYIMIDTDPTPNCTPFNINISSSSSPTCGLNYTISPIAFAPDLNNGTNIALPIDDRFSSSYVPIGFPFCFDGYQFTQLLVSSNGYVIFDPIGCASNLPGSNATPGAWSEYSIESAIPNTTDAPRNAILFPWQDIGPHLGGTIKYQVLGTAPNRRFVLTYADIPYYDCETQLFTGQLKLFETTNNIEIHLNNKEVCTTWTYSYPGVGILGLHNYNGTVAKVPTGHNFSTQWTANNEAWRFTCNCVGCIIPLPVQLVNFYAVCDGITTTLNWTTSSEENNDHFIVEKSNDAVTFETVITVGGAGNSNTIKDYSYVINSSDNAYYRLSQVDFDGKKTIHNVIYSNCYQEESINIYPNPANVGEEIEITGKFMNITVCDVLGKEIDIIRNGNKISNLAYGVYFVKIDNKMFKLIVR